jgi:hypothetical protein
MNFQKIILNAEEYEWAPAEVVSVDYETKNPSRLYTILCKFLNTDSAASPTDLIQARPINANIKQIPIKGEIVFVCKAPTQYHSGAGYGREFYYTSPISIQSSVHQNGLPGANKVVLDDRSNTQKASDAQLGLTSKLTDRTNVKDIIDPTFSERTDVFPIQPYSGDIIFEGRWGQSIRLGSTVDTRRRYQQNPSWGIGTGATGNPITIISNGTNPKKNEKTFNQFHIESPDNDDASIWLTSGQSVKFTPASKYTPSIFDKEIGLFRKNLFGGNQIILASDRIVLNANKQEIVGFSKAGIGFATEQTLALNGKNIVEIEGGKISLGFNATSPIILGDRLIELLKVFMDVIIDMNKSLIKLQVPTGVGPSGTPLNSGDYVSYVNAMNRLINSLPKLASKFAFVNEFSGGASSVDKNKFKELKSNNFVVKVPEKQRGDKSGTVTFND